MKKKFKTFKIITFGCRVNQAESRAMGAAIVSLFHCFIVDSCKDADLVVINTCCVTNKAEREVRKEIRRVKRENPECFLVVCGCWANKVKSEKLKVKSYSSKLKIDLLVENEDKLEWFKRFKKFKGLASTTSKTFYKDKYAKSKKAMVKIQEGCDNFCTYCIVPYVRGRSKSRSAKEIIKEINRLVKNGIEEIVLTGVDIASFNFQFSNPNFQSIFKSQFSNYKNDLVKLIRLILEETKIKKISFGSIGIEVFDDEFIVLYNKNKLRSTASKFFSSVALSNKVNSNHRVKGEPLTTKKKNLEPSSRLFSKQSRIGFLKAFSNETMKQCSNRVSSHFHIPLQSGCDETLKRMGRKYSVEEFIKTIKKIKKKISGFSFSTDIIVGFPGETKKEFNQTIRIIKTLKTILGKNFTKIHVFRYSPKEGTVAAKMEGKKGSVCAKASARQSWERVDEKEKKRRAARIGL